MILDPAKNQNQSASKVSNISLTMLSVLMNSPVIASVATALVTIVIPNAEAITVAMQRGIAFPESRAAIEQAQMWRKNLECAQDQQIKNIKMANGSTMSVTVCPSGDMLVQIRGTVQEKATARWVSFESINSSGNASIFNPLIGTLMSPAIAASTVPLPGHIDLNSNGSQTLAQSATVICQEDLGNGRIRRVIKNADGSCVTEEVDTYTGAVTRTPGQCQSC